MPLLPHEDDKPYEDDEIIDSPEPVVPVETPAPANA